MVRLLVFLSMTWKQTWLAFSPLLYQWHEHKHGSPSCFSINDMNTNMVRFLVSLSMTQIKSNMTHPCVFISDMNTVKHGSPMCFYHWHEYSQTWLALVFLSLTWTQTNITRLCDFISDMNIIKHGLPSCFCFFNLFLSVTWTQSNMFHSFVLWWWGWSLFFSFFLFFLFYSSVLRSRADSLRFCRMRF